VFGLLPHDSLVDLEAGTPKDPAIPACPVMAEEHRDAQPIVFDLVVHIPGTQCGDEDCSRPEPNPDPLEQSRLQRPWDVGDGVERDDAIEALGGEVNLGHVGADERRCGDVSSGKLDLRRRDVHARDTAADGQRLRHRHACPATKLEDIAAGRNKFERSSEPVESRLRWSTGTPVEVALRDHVVTGLDDSLSFGRPDAPHAETCSSTSWTSPSTMRQPRTLGAPLVGSAWSAASETTI